MSLFKLGDFKLHSGEQSNWIIDCDALTDDDLECLAHLGRTLVGPFGEVHGIPNGGLRFAKALTKYSTKGPPLIVDDVYTTGTSMEAIFCKVSNATSALDSDLWPKGLVIFSRRNLSGPYWVNAIFTIDQEIK